MVFCRPVQMSQVFLNIIGNAAYELEQIAEQEAKIISIRAFGRDGQAVIEISDNGRGISQDVLDRIMQPFFTTKPVGQGTGLGLSISLGIIQPKLLQTLLDLMQPSSARWARLRPRPQHVLTREIADWETSDALDRCAFGKRGMFMTLQEDETHLRLGDRIGFDLLFATGPVGHLTGTGAIVWKRNASNLEAYAAVGIELETVDEPGRGALLRYLEDKKPFASIPLRQGARGAPPLG